MDEVIACINDCDAAKVRPDSAAQIYAKIHMGLVHIHPFWDGNGRIARLLANLPLLKAGLPPLVIDTSLRREYIECLADYQLSIGQLNDHTGVWPDESQLKDFNAFCRKAYAEILKLIQAAVR